MDHFLCFTLRVCHALLSDQCSPVVICWERANLLFSCVFVTFPCGVLGLIVSVPDLCLLTYFVF